MDLEGKVAVVTGGSRGIGRAIASRLAEEGADIVISARSADTLQRTSKEISSATGRRVETVPADLSTLEGCQSLHKETTSRFGHVDILINCAGATKSGSFLELTDETWQDGFNLKFFGAVRLSRLFWPQLAESHGSVIHIVGGMARTPNPNFTIGGAVNA
ncbi:MAG: SDR family NAD(P)-dependent oxidoreductase, partial [Acidimicrobiia bacterium]